MVAGHGLDGSLLWPRVQAWADELGFSQIGVSDVDLSDAEPGLQAWWADGFHGSMDYMRRHGLKRARPAELVPGTLSVLTARMNYLPSGPGDWQAVEWQRMQSPDRATVSVYARGRDYHKVLRSRLQALADRIAAAVGPFGHRVFTDSAPVLEVELATRSGLGWRGKHTLALSREAGSMFFLGEIYLDVAWPVTEPVAAHCGSCTACIDVCPTQAIVAPYRLDARRCISYLTIEHAGPIPVEFRAAIGNRIYGCDDCQLVCPWNKYAQRSPLPDFDVRPRLADPTLLDLWRWSEADFLRHTEGSAIRRIGHQRWQRNLAVAIGNALRVLPESTLRSALLAALTEAAPDASELVREHIEWALQQSGVTAGPRSPATAAR
ncbi:MAG: tRNA epoxyqueuosine(34) reductase QueG [Burkholderiaceae bacterium]|nr:tRNA epoxyqueuosine(34) reductase QueG [Burkholderiaceae bacterium]